MEQYKCSSFSTAVTDNTSSKRRHGVRFTLCSRIAISKDVALMIFIFSRRVSSQQPRLRNLETQLQLTQSDTHYRIFWSSLCMRDVGKLFHNPHVAKDELKYLQKVAMDIVLVFPALTRWGTIKKLHQMLIHPQS